MGEKLTKEQFAVLVKAMKAVYVSDNFIPDKAAFEIWFTLLQDIQYQNLNIAIKTYMATKTFPPTIADLRQICFNTVTDIKDYGSAWESVMKAIKFYGSYRETEALDSLDELTRECVKRLGFREICLSENIVADRANFRQIYESLEKRKRVDNQIPIAIKDEQEKLKIDSIIKQIGGAYESRNHGC